MSSRTINPRVFLFFLAIVLVPSFLLRIPEVDRGMPYFEREDEAHHFDRITEMVQQGRYDPLYFNKPSFHFYLRMPVYVASFFVAVKKGMIRKVEEIRARDRFGIGGYAFSASHPFLVKSQRLFTILLDVGCVILVLLLALKLGLSPPAALGASLLVGLSPDMVSHSAIIGVDVPTTFLLLLTTLLAVGFYKGEKHLTFFWCALVAGLSVSTKYNALPIFAVPLVTLLITQSRSTRLYVMALFLPVAGFFLGSPYILSSLPLFMNNFGYEIWHYGVAGHAGHSAEPGTEQLLFYLNWFSSSALGIGALVCAGLGALAALLEKRRESVIALIFPALFIALMVFQKTNFTRNMHLALPFVALFAGVFIDWTARLLKQRGKKLSKGALGAQSALALVLLIQPGILSLQHATSTAPESRITLEGVLRKLRPADTVASGKLWLAPSLVRENGLTLADLRGTPFINLASKGFEHVLCHPSDEACSTATNDTAELVYQLDANPRLDRIVRNPSLRLYRVRTGDSLNEALMKELGGAERVISLAYNSEEQSTSDICQSGVPVGPEEEHCWTGYRLTRLEVENAPVYRRTFLSAQVMSPWQNQQIRVLDTSGKELLSLPLSSAGLWEPLQFELPKGAPREVLIETRVIQRPGGGDLRRLGVALRAFSLSASPAPRKPVPQATQDALEQG